MTYSAIIFTVTVFPWEDEMVWKKAGHLPSYAESKKMKSLAFHTPVFLSDYSLRDCLSS